MLPMTVQVIGNRLQATFSAATPVLLPCSRLSIVFNKSRHQSSEPHINRATLLLSSGNVQPDGWCPSSYYIESSIITGWHSIGRQWEVDGRGEAYGTMTSPSVHKARVNPVSVIQNA